MFNVSCLSGNDFCINCANTIISFFAVSVVKRTVIEFG